MELETVITSLQPVIIMATGILTVQIQKGLKWAIPFLAGLPSWSQPFITLGIASLLTLLGSFLGVVLPTDLELITVGNIEAILASTGVAMAAHAGMKARQK